MNNNEYDNNSNVLLNPDFVTGLSDAEGCLSVVMRKNKKAKYGVNVGLRFQIQMLQNETELLKMVKLFFDSGIIYFGKNNTVAFAVQDIYSIKRKVIPHFLKYPLRGTKYLDFLSFKKALDIIDNKEHLLEKGISKIYTISKNMNSYRKFSTSTYYSPSHTKENSFNYAPITGHYINGFIGGDGCLNLNLGKLFGTMYLSISQHKNNRLLMESIATHF